MSTSPRVLIVEDKPKTLVGTIKELERDGIVCRTVPSCEEAIRALSAEDWTAMVLDWSLPASVGQEPTIAGAEVILKYLQSTGPQQRNASLPFIVVTAHQNVVHERELKAYGGYHAVVYKLFMDDIKQKVLEILRKEKQ